MCQGRIDAPIDALFGVQKVISFWKNDSSTRNRSGASFPEYHQLLRCQQHCRVFLCSISFHLIRQKRIQLNIPVHDSYKERVHTTILLIIAIDIICSVEDETKHDIGSIYSIVGSVFLRRLFHSAKRSLGQAMPRLQIRHHHVVTLRQLLRRIYQKFFSTVRKVRRWVAEEEFIVFPRIRTEHRIITSRNCETNSG